MDNLVRPARGTVDKAATRWDVHPLFGIESRSISEGSCGAIGTLKAAQITGVSERNGLFRSAGWERSQILFGILQCSYVATLICADSSLCDSRDFQICTSKWCPNGLQFTVYFEHPNSKELNAYSRPSQFDRQTWRNPNPSPMRPMLTISRRSQGRRGATTISGVQRKNLGGCWYMM